MKSRQKVLVLFILAVLCLTWASPASAGAVKTPVTGTFSLTGGGPSDSREWWSSEHNNHIRNVLTYWEMVTDDARLNGWAQTIVNGDYNYDANGDLRKAHLWGEITIFQDQAYDDVLWDCHYTGWFEPDGKLAKIVCKGRGVNEGLIAKMTITTDSLLTSNYDLVGEILDPSGE